MKEVLALQTSGLDYHGTKYQISIHNFIYDAAARALIKAIRDMVDIMAVKNALTKGCMSNDELYFWIWRLTKEQKKVSCWNRIKAAISEKALD